jgi:EAL domain-containing protein (putative c-di-GMP-specific phosphodiesterase class I)
MNAIAFARHMTERSKLNHSTACTCATVLLSLAYATLCFEVPLPANQICSMSLVLLVYLTSRLGWIYGALTAAFGLLSFTLFCLDPRLSIVIVEPLQRAIMVSRVLLLMTIIGFEAWMQSNRSARTEQQRNSLREALSLAVELKQFVLHFQPIVDASNHRTIGMEALLRWNDPMFAHVTPDIFLPLVEGIGAMLELEDWIIRSACDVAATWPGEVGLHVNVSPQHVTLGLVDTVRECLEATSLMASRLTLEVVETSILENAISTKQAMEELRELGVSFALDDFGTGFASLQYLLQFPFNKIKLDRSFVRELLQKSQNQIVVRYVLAMAKEMKLSVTAEGVETEEQRAWLANEGVDQMQGYLFGRAAAAETLQIF